MRDRRLAAVAMVGMVACCATTALAGGVVGGFAFAAVGRFTAAFAVLLVVVLVMAWRFGHRRSHDCNEETKDRSAHLNRTSQ